MSVNLRGIAGEAKASWVKSIRLANKISAIAIQETMVSSVHNSVISRYWGKVFSVVETVVGSGDPINLINVYAPQNTSAKLSLWGDLSNVIDSSLGQCIVVGDFNAVRSSEERRHSKFKPGRKYTCIRENGKKLSKLDRFLVCSDFFNKWPDACVRALPNRYSDHCPIILELVNLNFGPRPFRVYNSWIGKSRFEDTVKAAVDGMQISDPLDSFLMSKFDRIRSFLKIWRDEFMAKENESEKIARLELENLEEEMESRDNVGKHE
ncbi:uncharacterized protein LOC110944510 [Helianthus annuus]|uniref:uncharacterized protein LOC110944510 n=1 Tax=Helianthus annuus TaxID=4232 RepID=UPI000B904E1F|nr:uncharacterized protein LOC110944510 [Helianthus annuus]